MKPRLPNNLKSPLPLPPKCRDNRQPHHTHLCLGILTKSWSTNNKAEGTHLDNEQGRIETRSKAYVFR